MGEESKDKNKSKKGSKKLEKKTESVEELKKDVEEKSKKTKDPSFIWKILAITFLTLFILSFGYILAKNLSMKECTKEFGEKIVEYINNNLAPVGTATLVNITDKGLYCEVVTEYMGKEIPVYVTKDGKTMFFGAIDLTKPLRTKQSTSTEFDAPDKEVPEVNLFVMSFCPFGNQAENAMKPVVELLGDKINIKVRYIVNFVDSSIEGRTLDINGYHILSLHGPNEAWENLVEVCVQKYYPNKFWDFVVKVNDKCTPIYTNLTELDNCWKSIANELNIDINKILNCTSNEGIQMLQEDEKLVEQYQVTGSPTLIINGKVYYGERTPNAFKEAICSGFIQKPEECNIEINESTTNTVVGSCS